MRRDEHRPPTRRRQSPSGQRRPLTRRERQLREERRRRRRRKLKIIRAAVIAGLIVFLIIIFLILKAIFGFVASLFNKEEEVVVVEEPKIYTASLLSVGDIVLHSPFLDSGVYQTEDGSYNFSPIFKYIKSTFEASDFSVIDLETTIVESNFSGYPLFRSPETFVSALTENGLDLCLLANNHIYDSGDAGLTSTIEAMDKYSLPYTGIRSSEEAPTYFIQDINGITVGMFNYTSETGSVDEKAINGIYVTEESENLINSFNYDNLDAFYDTIEKGLQEMKDAGVEYTVAYIHWGNEYQTEESEQQREIAQKLCDLGIDALIGSHPHVIQPVDLFTSNSSDHKMICCFSLGNHLSNQRQELMDSMPTGHTEDGLMVNLSLEQTDDGPVTLKEITFIPTWVYKNLLNEGAEYYVFPLHSTESYEEAVTTLNLTADIEDSLERTNKIIGEGVEKIQNELPITNEKTAETSEPQDTKDSKKSETSDDSK